VISSLTRPSAARKLALLAAICSALLLASAIVKARDHSPVPFGVVMALATDAPSCVHSSWVGGPALLKGVTVYNRCPYSYSGSYIRGKVVTAGPAKDSKCSTWVRNHYWHYEWVSPSHSYRLELC
jgi:hypothetical protein